VFFGFYLAFTGIAAAWSFASLVAFNFGIRTKPVKGPRISADAANVKELRSCNKKLERLLKDLHKETFKLQGQALKFRTDPAAEWRYWAEGWRVRWNAVAYKCRLGELSGQGINEAIDKMAEIHSALDELQLSYTGLVDKFIERYVERLRKLHADLDMVHQSIERQARQKRKKKQRELVRNGD